MKTLADYAALWTPAYDGEPEFGYVTQNRQHTIKGYSSCGDLCHCSLYNAGYRDPKLLNRDTPEGGKWVPSVNLSKLYGGSQKLGAWQPYKTGLAPNVGDIVLIGNYPKEQQHVFIISAVAPTNDGVVLDSYDYGQFQDGKNCGLKATRDLSWSDGRVHKGAASRACLGWIDVSKLVLTNEPVDYWDSCKVSDLSYSKQMGLNKYLADSLLNWQKGTAFPTVPTNFYVLLYTTMPAFDGTGAVEVAAGVGYTRQIPVFGVISFVAPGDQISNSSIINFGTATGAWGTVVGYGVADAASAGNLCHSGTFAVAKPVTTGDPGSFPIGNLTINAQ